MPIRQLSSPLDLSNVFSEQSPMGFTVVYIFEEMAPYHESILKPTFELISRECPFSQFVTIELESCNESFCKEHNLFTYPAFLVFKKEKCVANFSAETKYGLIKQMKKHGVLKEDAEIPNV
ncbi:hypothetical protein ABK040_014940 [Willaertia magna]